MQRPLFRSLLARRAAQLRRIALVLAMDELWTIASLQLADREMRPCHLLKMLHEGEVDRGPADRSDYGVAPAATFSLTMTPNREPMDVMRSTMTGPEPLVSPRCNMLDAASLTVLARKARVA